MEVSGEVEIDLIHRQHLGVATTGSTALDAEDRTEGGLAEGDDRLLADLIHPEGESDGDGSLADTGLGGRDGGDEDEVSGTVLLLLEDIQTDLTHVMTIPVVVSFIVFILLYFPCVATFVAIGKETGSYRWALFDALYTTIVAWLLSALAYYLTALLI